ncbi:helix-turn-helix transcriptional regulator [Dictyobacter alpinus]|nr:helix-turn-helix transcriptional regulator [Dictyobacter alpinus]
MLRSSNPVQRNLTHIWFGLLTIMSCGIVLFLFLLYDTRLFAHIFFIMQPLGWILVCVWSSIIMLSLAQQMGYTRIMRNSLSLWIRADPLPVIEMASADQSKNIDHQLATQVIVALELPFQHMGVRTENHQEAIERAMHALCCHSDLKKQAFSDYVLQLLLVAQQNWLDLTTFSPREREILELLLQDISYREMSNRLHVSMNTIKTHIYHIFQKLNSSNRQEAIQLIRERGWFSSMNSIQT